MRSSVRSTCIHPYLLFDRLGDSYTARAMPIKLEEGPEALRLTYEHFIVNMLRSAGKSHLGFCIKVIVKQRTPQDKSRVMHSAEHVFGF